MGSFPLPVRASLSCPVPYFHLVGDRLKFFTLCDPVLVVRHANCYPSSPLSEPWRIVFALNPIVGVVEGFRWALPNTDTAPGLMIVVSSLAALLILIGGLFYFKRMGKSFIDVV